MLEPDHAKTLAQSLIDRAAIAGATAADAIYVGDRSTSVEVRMGALAPVHSADGERIGRRLFLGPRSAGVAPSAVYADTTAVLGGCAWARAL